MFNVKYLTLMDFPIDPINELFDLIVESFTDPTTFTEFVKVNSYTHAVYIERQRYETVQYKNNKEYRRCDYFCENGYLSGLMLYYYNDYDDGMMCRAAKGGHTDLVNFFISKGSSSWNWGMAYAARGGHLNLMQFFISQGASDWNWGMQDAARGGHSDLIKFFISLGASDWESGMAYAAKGGHHKLVQFFISKGASNWNIGMVYAASGGHLEIVKFFIACGATSFDESIETASNGGHQEIVEYLKEQRRMARSA